MAAPGTQVATFSTSLISLKNLVDGHGLGEDTSGDCNDRYNDCCRCHLPAAEFAPFHGYSFKYIGCSYLLTKGCCVFTEYLHNSF